MERRSWNILLGHRVTWEKKEAQGRWQLQDFFNGVAKGAPRLVKEHDRGENWRKEWPYNFRFPGHTIIQDRFESTIWSLHLRNPVKDENSCKSNTTEYDRLLKIKSLYIEIVNACKVHFQPYQNIAIDERMVASKACMSMRQYMKANPTNFLLPKELYKKKNNPTMKRPFKQKHFKEKLAAEMLEFAKASAPPPISCMPAYYGDDGTQSRRYCQRCRDAGIKRVKTPVYCMRPEKTLRGGWVGVGNGVVSPSLSPVSELDRKRPVTPI
eukprot:superscaffoldBa00000043_g768